MSEDEQTICGAGHGCWVDDVTLLGIEAHVEYDGGIVRNWVEATVDGRRVRGEGGSPAEAMGALLYAALTGADRVLASNGTMKTMSVSR